MKNLFVRFKKEFMKDTSRKVDSTAMYYSLIMKQIPEAIRSFVGPDYLVKSSVGQGMKTKYPWIGIFDSRLTTSATKGLYVVVLFQSNMQGFYLTVDQGITNYANRFSSMKYVYARKVAQYFKDRYEHNRFSTQDIDLDTKKNDLGYGYEQANIISKYYHFDKMDQWSLEEDIKKIMDVYADMVSHILPSSYETFVDLVLEDELDFLVQEEEADHMITEALLEGETSTELRKVTLELVEPKKHKKNYVTKKSSKRISKVDYIKKAKEDSKVGFLGEKLVKDFEKERLMELGLQEYIPKIKWVSQESDSFGYDLESYDLHEEKVVKRYIEVKTSKMNQDVPFFVSENELKTSKRLADNYWIYRIYDVDSVRPKIYCIKGPIDSNFNLRVNSYTAQH